MSELKPCPFCGGESDYFDSVYNSGRNGIYNREYWVGCTECSVETCINDSDKSKEGAALIWNTRNDDALTERVKELEIENEALRSGLRIIAEPIAYLKEQARSFGNEFNGIAAVGLSKDSDWLKGIAKKLLEKE